MRCAATIASGMLTYKTRMPNAAAFIIILRSGMPQHDPPPGHSKHPSHLRRITVTTVLISQNDPYQSG
jgi:hypothetical protein